MRVAFFTFPWLILLFWSSLVLAAQEAIVTAEKAVIYADQLMTSPLGYVSQGKKIKVGEIPRNNAQVYPVIVSGKVAYIRVIDVSTEKMDMESKKLVADRFVRAQNVVKAKKFTSLSYLQYASQISLDKQPGALQDKDSLSWQGVALRSGVYLSHRWDFQVVGNYMKTKEGSESFTAAELGVGVGFKVVETRRFFFKWVTDFLAIPFANYSQGTLFRVNGYGFSVGSGLAVNYLFGKYWGLTAQGGFYHTRIMGLSLPSGFDNISPAFTGTRLSLGMSYYF